MFPIESFRNTLLKIVAILRQHSIPFHLTGGVTGVAYGEPRLTQDIDIVLQNEATAIQLSPFFASLQESDFIFDRAAVERKKMFQLFDLVESLKLDIHARGIQPIYSISVEIFERVSLPIVFQAGLGRQGKSQESTRFSTNHAKCQQRGRTTCQTDCERPEFD